jgi:hypothetical protein
MYDAKHPLIVMRDVGISVLDEINSNNLRVTWRSNPQLRRTFPKDVGECALNLVVSMNLCHNDIRAPNIMISFRGDYFVSSISTRVKIGVETTGTCSEAFRSFVFETIPDDVLDCANRLGGVTT